MIFDKNVVQQFLKFIIIGCWSAIANYGTFYVLFAFVAINYLIASAIGFIVGIFAGYGLNKKWTFSITKKTNIWQYYMVYMASLLLSLLFLALTVDMFGVDPIVANVLAIGLTTCTNFIAIKLFVFNE